MRLCRTKLAHQLRCGTYFIGRLYSVLASHFGVNVQNERMFDLKINVDHCDLNVMVQWFLDMTVSHSVNKVLHEAVSLRLLVMVP